MSQTWMLYHEKQVAALCGVHCINTLLQGPFVSEVDLAQIAQELDALEKAVMQEGGLTSDDYLKFAAEESGNVAADGMFSIQVLAKALEVWGLQVVPADHPDMKAAKSEPQNEAAFICNLQEHWFTVRRIDGDWWNFNSLFPAPQPLGSFYLAAFLGQLEEEGYQIFVVRGQLPQPEPEQHASSSGAGQWMSPEVAKELNDKAAGVRQRGRAANAVETVLSKAAASGGMLQLRPKRARQLDEEWGAGGPSETADEDLEDADLAAAIAASLGEASGPGPSADEAGPSQAASARPQQGARGVAGAGRSSALDADLAAAIAASLGDQAGPSTRVLAAPTPTHPRGARVAESPDAGNNQRPPGNGWRGIHSRHCWHHAFRHATSMAGVVELAFRLPSSQRVSRRFSTGSAASALYRFVGSSQGLPLHTFTISLSFPRKELPNSASLLSDLDIMEPQLLQVNLNS